MSDNPSLSSAAMVLRAFRHALRDLCRTPRFALIVSLTLALAVGGTSALLSVFNALVLRKLPVREPERLIAVFPANGEALLGIPASTLAELRDRQTVLEELCGFSRGAVDVDLQGVISQRVNESLTGHCYQMLGVQAFLGRLIDERDAPLLGEPAPVVVISHRFWTDGLRADPTVIGRTLRVQGVPLTIIGVTPHAFAGFNADEAPDLTIPLGMAPKLLGRGSVLALYSVGRLRDDVTLANARAQLRELWPRVLVATNPPVAGQQPSRVGSLRVESIARGLSLLRERHAQALSVLLGLAALLLLLACVNVGGLFLARTMARDQALGIQMALGASHGTLAVQALAEGIIVALCAAIAAVPIAWWISRALAIAMWTGARPLTMEVTPDERVLIAIASIGFLAGLLVSLPPVALLRLRPPQFMRGQPRTVSAHTQSWRRALLVAQVAASLVLVFCAGLFARNLASIRGLDPGYPAGGLLWMRLELPFGQPRSIDQAAYFRPLLDQVAALPEVTHVALALGFPTTEVRHVAGRVPLSRGEAGHGSTEVGGRVDWVSQGFFETVGIPLRRGREFTWSDTAHQPAVTVINESLASRLFPNGDAVGQRVGFSDRTQVFTVVGVVADASPGDVRIRHLPIAYRPLLQNPQFLTSPILLVRASKARGLAEGIRRTIESLGRHRVVGVQTIEDQTNRFLVPERVLSGVSSAFAGLSVLVGGLGLCGLLAYTVARRIRELGVRMAHGATRANVLVLVVRDGMVLTLMGVAIGLPLALACGRAASGLLFEFSPYDPISLAAAGAVLVVVGFVACAIPAMRAARIKVTEALHEE